MYRKFSDPHGQSNSAKNSSHKLYEAIIKIVCDLPLRGVHTSRCLRYLDVGCGLGLVTSQIARSLGDRINAYGIDISETAIEKAKKIDGGISFLSGSILDQRFIDRLGSFDLATCFETLYYFKEEEIMDVQENLSRLVATGGYLVITYHLPDVMTYGRYIQNLDDIESLFTNFQMIWSMDFNDRASIIYNGESFGRHLFAILQRG